ncbi:MAG: hypothetical protein Q7I99_04120 [Acholeplasmataceae bacterium]|nr:hypothetical protein [Acholeplasmataceae bacterium]
MSIPLTYPSSYLGNPTMIGSKTLSWEDRRLKAIPSDSITYALVCENMFYIAFEYVQVTKSSNLLISTYTCFDYVFK